MRITQVEFSEGTYAYLWNAVTKTGDNETNSLFKEVCHKEEYPVLHYTMAKDLFFGFLGDIEKYKVKCDINVILKNARPKGYFLKHYR